jgi:hypothetical protein
MDERVIVETPVLDESLSPELEQEAQNQPPVGQRVVLVIVADIELRGDRIEIALDVLLVAAHAAPGVVGAGNQCGSGEVEEVAQGENPVGCRSDVAAPIDVESDPHRRRPEPLEEDPREVSVLPGRVLDLTRLPSHHKATGAIRPDHAAVLAARDGGVDQELLTERNTRARDQAAHHCVTAGCVLSGASPGHHDAAIRQRGHVGHLGCKGR